MANIFTRWFKKEPDVQERALPPSQQIQMLLNSFSGSDLDETQIIKEAEASPMFWACLNLIANNVSSADYFVTKYGRRVQSWEQDKIKDLINSPNTLHSQNTFFWLMAGYLLSVGSVFIWVRKDGSMIPLSPTCVIHQGGTGYQFQYGGQNIEATLYKDLVKITTPSLQNPFSGGLGMGQVLSQELDISETASTHELGYLKNHAVPSLLINYKGMSDDNLIKLKSQWDQSFKGSKSAGKTGFSNSEGLQVTELSSSFKDLGLIDLRGYSDDVIRQAFGISKEMLGVASNSQRTGIEAAEYLFQKNVVKPRVDLIVAEFNAKVLPLLDKSKGYRLEVESVIPSDKEYSLKVAQTFSSGIPQHMTLNEARAIQGLPPIEGGDTLGGQVGTAIKVKEDATERTQPKMRCTTGGYNERLHFVLEDIIKELPTTAPRKELE